MRGFTLTEVLIVVAIALLVVGAIYGGYDLSQRSYQEGQSAAEILQNGRVILERLTREIRQAREVATGLPMEESVATSTIMFEDGHIQESYYYIHYFQENNLVKREAVGYYFSGDPSQTLVAWDAQPPEEQTLESKVLESLDTIGEYVESLKFWNPGTIHISLILEKKDQIINLETSVSGRNF